MPTTRSQSLPVDGAELPLTVTRGDARGPAVVIVPSIFGVQPDLVAQMEEIALDAPYVAAMDPFFRTEPGPLPYADPPRAIERMNTSDTEAAYGDFRALLEHGRGEGSGKVIAVGICFGGPFCFLAAADGAVDGVVTWHGSRLERYLERAGEMRCPMRLHFGDADPVVPPEAVEKVREAFGGRADVEITVHPGASHGFSHRDAPAHDEAAERASVEAVRELARQLG